MNQNQTKKLSCCDKLRSIFRRKQDIQQVEEQNQPVSMVTEKPLIAQTSTIRINDIQEEVHEQFLKYVLEKRKQDWMKYFHDRQIFTIEKLVLAFQNSKTSIIGRKANGAELSVLERIYNNFNSGLTTFNWTFQSAQLLDLKNQQNPTKNVLVLGITGQGKSTFINCFYNSIQGFKFEQPVRYKVIQDPNENTKAKSVTKQVQSYGMNVPNFAYNMIDTPGLADTDGPERDQAITDQISEFLLQELHRNNQSLHQVILVSQSSTDYLIKDSPTLNQLALLNVLKLFGKDMSQYHTHVLTFSDFTQANQSNYESQSSIFNALTTQYISLEYTRQLSSPQFTGSPQILDSESQNLLSTIRDQKKCYCQLQNSVFFAKEVGMIQKIQLKKNLENYNKLIEKINESQGFTLDQTSVVINERKNIREKINILNDELRVRVRIDQILQSNIKKLQIFQERMDSTEDFEFKEFEPIIRREDTKYYVTNCSACENSCHINCQVPTESLITCNMMIESQGSYVCAACNHDVKTHKNDKFKFVKDVIEKTITKEDLKAEHMSAQEQHQNIQRFQDLQMQKQQENDLKIKVLLGELRYSFNQLYTSALYQVDFKGQSLKEFLYKYFREYANQKMLDKFFEEEIDLMATKRQLNAIPLIQQTMVFRFQHQPALQQ